MDRLASCSCGQLTARVTGEPVRISICHCLACQRRTGSPFSQQARFSRENVVPAGASVQYTQAGDEGPGARFHSCPNCHATVYYEPLALPEHISIPVGAFADPAFPAPTVSVYEGRKHGWVAVPGFAEHY